jgi:GNAT superfamily N-acetyltransferase
VTTKVQPAAPIYSIRPLDDDDSIADLTALLHRAYKRLLDMGLRYLATHQTEDVTRRRITAGRCFVAVAGDRIVGTINYAFPYHWPGVAWFDQLGVAEFGQFAVEPQLQGTGIGSALLAHVEQLARGDGAAELSLNTAQPAQHLIAYYMKRGYRVVDYTDATMPNYRSVILSKRLH